MLIASVVLSALACLFSFIACSRRLTDAALMEAATSALRRSIALEERLTAAIAAASGKSVDELHESMLALAEEEEEGAPMIAAHAAR